MLLGEGGGNDGAFRGRPRLHCHITRSPEASFGSWEAGTGEGGLEAVFGRTATCKVDCSGANSFSCGGTTIIGFNCNC